jgi:hypothetical protein
MPCLLKERTHASPGIITFTHNEALRGVAARSHRVRAFLDDSVSARNWLFGVHIQGHLNMTEWPLETWQSFIMWPDTSVPYLANVPKEKLLGVNCINFMPDIRPRPPSLDRNVDILVISRASTIKRIYETLFILRGLMDKVPNFRATVVVPDMRQFELGEECYDRQGIDRRLFEMPRKLFSSQELKRLSFIATSQQAFGWFPLSDDLLIDMLHRSKFVLLTSHQEGTPRVLAESLLADVPCIVSDRLESGISKHLDERNSVKISDDRDAAVTQIQDALQRYDRFSIDRQSIREAFLADRHLPQLRSILSAQITAHGKPVEGRWFLDDLHLRLAGHGRKYSFQFMNQERVFFDWLAKNDPLANGAVGEFDPYEEDRFFGVDGLDDGPMSLTSPKAPTAQNTFVDFMRRLGARNG